jgi:hypothetical protein
MQSMVVHQVCCEKLGGTLMLAVVLTGGVNLDSGATCAAWPRRLTFDFAGV